MPNIYAVHFDPLTWPEPEEFQPSRHLTEEGKLCKRDELIPFSVGMLNFLSVAKTFVQNHRQDPEIKDISPGSLHRNYDHHTEILRFESLPGTLGVNRPLDGVQSTIQY